MTAKETQSLLQKAALNGEAYRVSKRHDLDQDQELIVFFKPVSAGGTIHIETPAISSPQNANVDVWENPSDPSNNFGGDLEVHVTRYDATPETPEATIDRVTTGNLTTTSADKTEETRIQANEDYNTPGGSEVRGIWRTIPVGETIAMVITDKSTGSGNTYGFDTMVYEGSTLRD